MFEAAYRQRLEADLANWQRDGVITPSIGDAIRAKLGPMPQGVSIPTVVAIVGALLIAAAFLAFVAANWTEIARPARFAILLAGIAASYALAAWFDRAGRIYLADVCATVGSIVFGAAIALTGQMYHLGGDFAAGVFLWAAGALIAAALTGSRGALAVTLAVACFWTTIRVEGASQVPHLNFAIFWLIAAGLAIAWNATTARHLVAVAALAWWIITAVSYIRFLDFEPIVITAAGEALLFGAGLALANVGPETLRRFGGTLASYAALAFVVVVTLTIIGIFGDTRRHVPDWVMACGIVGFVLALIAAAIGRSVGAAIAALAIGIGLALATGLVGPMRARGDPWLAYALALIGMLSLVVSGMLDNVRPRLVAGWIGLAAAIAAITWSVEGSLLKRAVFLAFAGAVAVGLAILLGRIKPKERGA